MENFNHYATLSIDCLLYTSRQRGGRRMSDWMDNQDVCQVLKISPRTLQTLRDSGRLPHSKINNRIYYRPEDVERLIADCNDV